jgi:hypothetical protein
VMQKHKGRLHCVRFADMHVSNSKERHAVGNISALVRYNVDRHI